VDSVDELAAQVTALYRAGTEAMTKGAEHFRQVGLRLLQIREKLQRGEWEALVHSGKLPFSRTQAYRYIRLAKCAVTVHLEDRWRTILGNDDPPEDEPTPQAKLPVTGSFDPSVPPLDARFLLQLGQITPAAAEDMRRLYLFDKVATLKEACGCHNCWADHYGKLILWGQPFARTNEEVRLGVDGAMADLAMLWTKRFEGGDETILPEDCDGYGRCDPDPYFARLDRRLRPDFSRLDDEEWRAIVEGTEWYCENAPAENAA
jgi:hypothetical protein